MMEYLQAKLQKDDVFEDVYRQLELLLSNLSFFPVKASLSP